MTRAAAVVPDGFVLGRPNCSAARLQLRRDRGAKLAVWKTSAGLVSSLPLAAAETFTGSRELCG